MSIISLTTDMGTRDYYVGMLKGAIYSLHPEAKIVDLSHDVKPFYIPEAAFILKHAYKAFPKGTVHLISVNPEVSEDVQFVVVKMDDQYFIGADNGIFSMIFEKEVDEVFSLENVTSSNITFPSRDVFVTAASHLSKGGTLEVLGKRLNGVMQRPLLAPVTHGTSTIQGSVVHIDRYENAITNITEEMFRSYGKGRPFEICFHRTRDNIRKISTSYNQVSMGEKLALFGCNGYLEIAQNQGNASSLLGLAINHVVRIEFHDRQVS
jgi:hypothetical protein